MLPDKLGGLFFPQAPLSGHTAWGTKQRPKSSRGKNFASVLGGGCGGDNNISPWQVMEMGFDEASAKGALASTGPGAQLARRCKFPRHGGRLPAALEENGFASWIQQAQSDSQRQSQAQTILSQQGHNVCWFWAKGIDSFQGF